MPPRVAWQTASPVGSGSTAPVRLETAQSAGERSVRPAELLVHDRLDDHVAAELDAALAEAAERVQAAGDAALHVHRASAVEASGLDLALPVAVQAVAERGHDVDVSGEEERAAASPARQAGGDVPAALVVVAGPPGGMLGRAVHLVRTEDVRPQAEVGEVASDEGLARPLLAVRRPVLAAERDELTHEPHELSAVLLQPGPSLGRARAGPYH